MVLNFVELGAKLGFCVVAEMRFVFCEMRFALAHGMGLDDLELKECARFDVAIFARVSGKLV